MSMIHYATESMAYMVAGTMDAGYDDIDAMIDQMRTPLPIKDSTFREIGITKPGHVVRVMLKLEEDASMTKSIKNSR